MLNYLHDIRNKLTIVSGHTNRLAQKYNADDFVVIKTNLVRINELINEAYEAHISEKKFQLEKVELNHFIKRVELLIDALDLNYSLKIKNELHEFDLHPVADQKVFYSVPFIIPIIENALDNAVKANSSQLIIRAQVIDCAFVLELVDNGSGICLNTKENSVTEQSALPHGLGKNIMSENMKKLNGKISWTPRMDASGMIVRLSFPLTF